MLKRTNRLTTKFQFNITKKYGIRSSYGTFNVITLIPKNYSGPAQIGIVVPNSVHKKAAKRNKIKRWLREAVRKNIARIPTNTWVAIFATNRALDTNYEEISAQVDKFIQKISGAN